MRDLSKLDPSRRLPELPVMTTGATQHELARSLRKAGASSVQAWVLARTPDPRY